jgi:hypothetical protein
MSYRYPEFKCVVCDEEVEPDGDYSDSLEMNIAVPGNGCTRCDSCSEWVHEACLAPNDDRCISCATCDTFNCSALWTKCVIKGGVELAPSIGTHAQEFLCTQCFNIRAGVLATLAHA